MKKFLLTLFFTTTLVGSASAQWALPKESTPAPAPKVEQPTNGLKCISLKDAEKILKEAEMGLTVIGDIDEETKIVIFRNEKFEFILGLLRPKAEMFCPMIQGTELTTALSAKKMSVPQREASN